MNRLTEEKEFSFLLSQLTQLITISKTKFKDTFFSSGLDEVEEIEEYFIEVFAKDTLPMLINMQLIQSITDSFLAQPKEERGGFFLNNSKKKNNLN